MRALRNVYWGCCLMCSNAVAGEMSSGELASLPLEDQRALLRGMIEARIDSLRNIEILSRTCSGNFEFNDGNIGKLVMDNGCYNFRLQRLDSSYRLDAELFVDQTAQETVIETQTNFNHEEGESRNFTRSAPLKRPFGRIDSKRNNTVELNRAAYYLAGAPDANQGTFFEPFLHAVDRWTIEVFPQRDEVVISCPFEDETLSRLNASGSRTLVFDCSKTFAPVRSTMRWRLSGKAEDIWRNEVVFMKDFRDVAGHWVPFVFEEQVRASPLGEGICTIRTTRIEKVSIGVVKPTDLAISFPEGTFVTDAIRGVSYTTGVNGNAKDTPVPFFEHAELSQSKGGLTTSYVLWINVAIIVILAFALIYRRIARRVAL